MDGVRGGKKVFGRGLIGTWKDTVCIFNALFTPSLPTRHVPQHDGKRRDTTNCVLLQAYLSQRHFMRGECSFICARRLYARYAAFLGLSRSESRANLSSSEGWSFSES
jgi:hypothetical protein